MNSSHIVEMNDRFSHMSLSKSSIRKLCNIRVGTFNVCGLNSIFKQECLVKDMQRYGIDIICMQETKMAKEVDKMVGKYRLLSFPSSTTRWYGNGSSLLHAYFH